MAVGTEDLHKAINTAWDASDLDDAFKALWTDPTETEFFVLMDQLGPGAQPLPYVVMEQSNSSTINRMSGGVNALREVRDIEVRFNIYAREVSGDARDNKEIAADLAEEIMKVFGGHPTESPSGTITLDNGKHLITTYQNGFGLYPEEDVYQWVLIYNFRVDVPVAV